MDTHNDALPVGQRNVLLVDDSAAVRERLADLLEQTAGIGWVARAGGLAEARRALAERLPDVVVLDIELGDGSGVELLTELRAGGPPVEIIMLTNYPTVEFRAHCLDLGADHFLDKTLEFQRIPCLICAHHHADDTREQQPRDEMSRLLSLLSYQVLDTPAEQAYDDLTALAAQICGVPVALISLVDADRQWFKSCHGLDLRSTDRSVAFCAHAIADSELLEVPDARHDPRFARNPLVDDPNGVVFYAGVPLTVAGGHNVGTLCVVDHVPRRLSAEQRTALKALARQVVALLEQRRVALELQQSHEHRSALEHTLEVMSTRDALTGVDNRSAFRYGLERALTLAARQHTRLACLYIDLDNFKLVNDSLGHPVGDALLVEASQRVKDSIRESDIFARLGGDEFGLVLNGVNCAEDVAHLATKLRDSLSAPYVIGGHVVHGGCSIGISLAPDDGDDLDTLLRHADIALYHAKEAGKGDFRFYTEELNERVVTRMRVEQELREAVETGAFELHFQPQIDCDNQRVVGAEALLRWPRGARDPIGPGVFIPLAEELRLGQRIGAWVLNEACMHYARWRSAGLELERLAVNVSASQLHASFAAEVLAVLARHAIEPGVLEVEVIESQIVRDLRTAGQAIAALRAAGVRVALDDFGTGYSSLTLLRELDVDRLKIDRSFVAHIALGDGDTAIVSAMTALAHRLGLRVTAEGVERADQLVALRAMDCDDFQGYLVSPALDAEAFARFCQEWTGDI